MKLPDVIPIEGAGPAYSLSRYTVPGYTGAVKQKKDEERKRHGGGGKDEGEKQEFRSMLMSAMSDSDDAAELAAILQRAMEGNRKMREVAKGVTQALGIPAAEKSYGFYRGYVFRTN